jgi:hypothetical protein
MTDKLLTPEFRVSHPNVFEAKTNDLNGKKEYSLVAIFAKGADLSDLKKAAEAAATERWGADKSKWPPNIRSPFRKCSERWKNEDSKQIIPAGYEEGDAFFITFKANEQFKPGVVDQNVKDIIEPREFYPGCYARASIRPFAYPSPKAKGPATANKGVSFGLNHVQKLRDGDPLGGSSRPTDDFKPVEGASAPAADSVFG